MYIVVPVGGNKLGNRKNFTASMRYEDLVACGNTPGVIINTKSPFVALVTSVLGVKTTVHKIETTK